MTAIYKRKRIDFRSVADLNELVINTISTLPKDLTLVVAVPRSGYLVASLIALYLNLPLCSYSEYISQRIPGGGRRTKNLKFSSQSRKKVLVVDDSVASGWEMRRIREQFEKSGITDETFFLAAYVGPNGRDLVDIALETTDSRHIFEWNLYHHPHLINSCVDIDGVLCRDASKKEDDDGERYRDFLENVAPRIIPTVKIGWLVTSRLEKYRELTENWLEKNGVQYNKLIMQDLPDLATRRKLKSDAKFKANIYAGIGAFFFVESSARQAREISRRTGKAVFCVDNRSFIQAKTLKGKGWDMIRSRSGVIAKAGSKLSALRAKLKKN